MKPTWDRARYLLDRTIARGPRMLLFLHFVVSAVVLGVTAIVAWRFTLYDSKGRGLIWNLWFNTVLALDPGTAANLEDGATHQLASVVLVAVIGLVIVGSLIALIHNAVEYRVGQMRKGTAKVMEDGHVVIIGWSRQTLLVVRNLLDERAGVRIAILADRGRVEMEDELRAQFRRPSTHRIVSHPDARFGAADLRRIVCRTGNPIDPDALHIVSPETADSIIVLAPEVDQPDAHVLKVLLALTDDLQTAQRQVPIVAQLVHSKNLGVAEEATERRASIIATSGVVARALVQASRQASLTAIIEDLVESGENDVHFLRPGLHAHHRFGDLLNSFSDACVVGMYDADIYVDGMTRAREAVKLNPEPDAVLTTHHGLIVISRQDGEPVAVSGPNIHGDAIVFHPAHERTPEKTLILGWSQKVSRIVKELNTYAATGSEIRVVADLEAMPDVLDADNEAKHVNITVERSDPTDRHILDDLGLSNYQHVIVVACSEEKDAQYADARTIMTLLHLREIARGVDCSFSVAAEILDTSNRRLARFAAGGRATIIDDEFIGHMLTRIAANRRLYAIIADLFDSEGSEIYFKPAREYVTEGTEVNFATVVESARRRSEVAIGVQKAGSDPELNPSKSESFTFGIGDRIVVLAQA